MVLAACSAYGGRVTESFNAGWEFEERGVATAVDLPHDWAIAGPFDPKGWGATGRLPWKDRTATYRKTLVLPVAFFFGTAAFFLRFYGGNLLLNFFFGPAVNAAKGISSSVSSAISRFRDNFITALNPQINKSYAQQDREFFFSLVFSGCRLSLFLMLLLTAPLLLSTSFILELWLGNVPGYAVVFTQLVLGYEIIEGITCPLITAMLATGDIKRYELAVGSCELLYLPLTWLLLRCGSYPEIVLVMSIIISLLILAVRLMFLRRKTGLNIRGFLREVIWRAILVTLAGLTLPLALSFLISEGWSSFLTLTLLSLVTMGASIFFIGCDKKEQAFLRDKCGRLLRMKR